MTLPILRPNNYDAFLSCLYCQRFVIEAMRQASDGTALCETCWHLGEPYRQAIARYRQTYDRCVTKAQARWRAACEEAVAAQHQHEETTL